MFTKGVRQTDRQTTTLLELLRAAKIANKDIFVKFGLATRSKTAGFELVLQMKLYK